MEIDEVYWNILGWTIDFFRGEKTLKILPKFQSVLVEIMNMDYAIFMQI